MLPKRADVRYFMLEVVKPTLAVLDLDGAVARALMAGTAVHESNLVHRKQIGGGPARGLFQMERATFDDIYNRFMRGRPFRLTQVNGLLVERMGSPWEQIETNDRFACALARLKYWADPAPLPSLDAAALAAYHKRIYNTPLGKTDPAVSVHAFALAIEAL